VTVQPRTHPPSADVPIMRVLRPIGSWTLHWLRSYPCVPLRRAVAEGRAVWTSRLPGALRRRMDLEGEPIEPLRVEIGSGAFPASGYVHVDADRRAKHLEYVAPAWKLPFASGSVEEILAVHVLEHVHPGRLLDTLREWRRVLRPGGAVEIHVPNAPAIIHVFEGAPWEHRWALVNGLLGMYRDANVSSPDDLDPKRDRPDHKVIYDVRLLEDALATAGFADVEDLTGVKEDRHTQAWRHLVPHYSIIVRARVGAELRAAFTEAP
jgi:SAM-dependent methyltransferase